jgi:tRNA A37 threonylcarbamoyltransferase TsaD
MNLLAHGLRGQTPLRTLRSPRSGPFLLIRPFTVLGIETSCDDTCVALLSIPPCSSSPPTIQQNIIRRSLALSEPYGGIVPTIVGQFHAKNLAEVLCEVREQAGLRDLGLIAVTRGMWILGC